jgi:hypothetical protein
LSKPTNGEEVNRMNSDFDALLSRLARYRVKYLIVGGYAVIHYCEPRYTKDIDIFVEASTTNARRLRAALEDFAGPLPDVTDDDLADPKRVIMMGRPPQDLATPRKRASGRPQDLLDLEWLRAAGEESE